MKQSTNHIFLVRPAHFGYNSQTANSNAFQTQIDASDEDIKERSIKEFDNYIKILRSHQITVHVVQDTENPVKPDAIFPNNWGSFHHDGTVILYPMEAENRRFEKRKDILDRFKESFVINNIIDLSHYEQEGKFCEGTGSIIFDHINKIAYAALSSRTNIEVVNFVCKTLNYKPITFTAYDTNDIPIYHTNVMMCVSEKFAVLCLESIKDKNERKSIINALEKTGHDIIDITQSQVKRFVGNLLSIQNKNGKEYLIISRSAYHTLTSAQLNMLSRYCELLPVNIETIETIGGGSVRCMISEIFLPTNQPV